MSTPDRPSVFTRFLGHRPTTLDRLLLGALAVTLSLLLVLGFCVFLPALARLGGAPTNTPSGPAKVNGPFLGGTESIFQVAFGAPIGGNSGQFRQYQPTIDGTHVKVIALVGAGGVTDRMRFLRIAPGDQGVPWPAGTGVTLVKKFLPPDSRYQKDKPSPDVGIEHVYVSQLLAASFPASVFTDIDTNAPLPPGTLDYYCGGDVNADGGCALNLGA